MERGIYFDGWFPRQYCSHPSLPPRRLKMVEELDDVRGTMLVWSALGGGSISLPYLEEEAFGEVPQRYRHLRLRQRRGVHRALPRARHRRLRHRLRVAGLGVRRRGRRRHGAGAERGARRRAALLPGAARVQPGHRPGELEAVPPLLPRRAGQQRRRAGHRPVRGVRQPRPAGRPLHAHWVEVAAATSPATTWTATTLSGANTSRRSSASRSTPGSPASSWTRPTPR